MNGRGPSPMFVAQLAAAFGGTTPPTPPADPFAAGAALAGYGPPSAAPALSVAGAPPPPAPPILAPPPGPPTDGPPPPPPPPPGGSFLGDDPTRQMSRPPEGPNMTQGPPPAPEAPPQHEGFHAQVLRHAGLLPAHEVDLRGPSLTRAQDSANEATSGAITRTGDRTQELAAYAYQQGLDQEREARARQAGIDQSMAEQAEELAQRQADFDQSARQLSKMSVDPERFWASRSTGQKIAALISIGLGGFVSGARGGSNVGLDIINTAIDRDIHSQEVAFHIAHDATEARRTAFGMAMEKYKSEDAARTMARAAALDAVSAQIAQQRGLEVGTSAANTADQMLASLAQQRATQVAQGIRFVLPQQQGRTFLGEDGLIYSEQEMKGISKEQRGFEQDREKIGLGTAGDIMKEGAKAAIESRGTGGLGKAGAEKLALEDLKAQRELDAGLAAIGNAQKNVGAITAGGMVGSAASGLPSGLPGVADAQKNTIARENYNRRAWLTVAAAYKLSADTTEPRNKAILEHFTEHYTIKPGDNERTALRRMSALRQFLEESAVAKGAQPPAYPESFTAHGGK